MRTKLLIITLFTALNLHADPIRSQPINIFGIASSNIFCAEDPIIPDAQLTPGAVFTNVTVEQVCAKGYANVLNGGVRNVPESEKRAVFIEYFGKVPTNTADYEIDHLISLELGGCNDMKNLWPQSYTTQPWNAHIKDKVEDRMAALLREELKTKGHDAATALMKQFQTEISQNWTNAYQKYVAPDDESPPGRNTAQVIRDFEAWLGTNDLRLSATNGPHISEGCVIGSDFRVHTYIVFRYSF